jgi:hypothetical protein
MELHRASSFFVRRRAYLVVFFKNRLKFFLRKFDYTLRPMINDNRNFDKIKIVFPQNYFNERVYVLTTIFEIFLGLDKIEYISSSEQTTYSIIGPSGQVTINDHFFNKFKENSSDDYLYKYNIPEEVFTLDCPISGIDKPLGFFGSSKIIFTSDNSILVDCDIFAVTFFMLTRWEEYVISARNSVGQFPTYTSLIERSMMHNRPIVDEYCILLAKYLSHIGYKDNIKKYDYKVNITHDVDYIQRWNSTTDFMTRLGGDILRRKHYKPVSDTIISFLKSRMNFNNDPWYNFDYLMDLSEHYNSRSHFFFMAGKTGERDTRFDIDQPLVKSTIQKIKGRGHYIGFHPGIDTSKDSGQWVKEYQRLCKCSGIDITTGRQHYLLFEPPITSSIWDKNNMTWDSSLGFHDKMGFRCGTAKSFPLYNFLEKRTLKVQEKPLILMDVALIDILKGKKLEEVMWDINTMAKKIQKLGGEFTILWHNSSFFYGNLKDVGNIYEQILSNIFI